MAYFLNLFTPETWSAFQEHGAGVSGFRYRQRRRAREEIKPGDIFVCYLVRLSRWCGVLKIASQAYDDETPIYADPDPYVVRFEAEPLVLLQTECSIPVQNREIWDTLSITKERKMGARGWSMIFRSSLRQIDDSDGEFLVSRMEKQDAERRIYPFTDADQRYLTQKSKVPTPSGEVTVETPLDEEDDNNEGAGGTGKTIASPETRKSILM